MNNKRIQIGIVADAQYADCPNDLAAKRFYSDALDRLAEAVSTFDQRNVDVILNLGDLIEKGWNNLAPALEILENAKAPVFHLPGNHDFTVEPDFIDKVRSRLEQDHGEYPHRYQITENLRILILDATAVSLFGTTDGTPSHLEASGWFTEMSSAGKINAKSYNGGLGDHQRHWLRRELTDARGLGEHVIIACHQPIYGGSAKYHLWDAELVTKILDHSPGVVIAWLAGHSHQALQVMKEKTLHWQAAAMVDSQDQNAYAIMHVESGSISIEGFGRQLSFTNK